MTKVNAVNKKNTYRITVNGEIREVTAAADTKLIYILRNHLQLNSPRLGCGDEDCGACRILLEGETCFSCTTTIGEVASAKLTTLEGLADNPYFRQLQQSFLNLNAGQCGYCLSGILVSATKLLETNNRPARREIQQALENHLCRCGAHNRVIKAVQEAAGNLPNA